MLSYDVSMFIIKLILIAMVIAFVMLVIYQLIVNDVGIENLRAQIFVERTLTAPTCLSYYDEETGRSYPNVIDMAKFNDKEILKKCIDNGDREFISAKLTLRILKMEMKIFYFITKKGIKNGSRLHLMKDII